MSETTMKPRAGASSPAAGGPSGALSSHAIMHGMAFFVLFISLIAACFVFGRRFAGLGQRGLAAYCMATGVVTPVLIVLGVTGPIGAGIPFFAAGVLAF